MGNDWRATLHGEWIRDDVGLVALVEGRGWYAYPFRPGLPNGPFGGMDEAMRSLDAPARKAAIPAQAGALPTR